MARHSLSSEHPEQTSGRGTVESGKRVIEMMLRRSASGSLSIVSREGVLTVSLRRGWVVGLSPSQGSGDAGLGDLLVEQGYISRIELDTLQEAAHSGGRTLRELILERGIIPSETLAATLQEWVEGMLLTAFGWEDASFQLHTGATPIPAAGLTPFPLLDFLLSRRERLGARSPLPSDLPEATARFRLLGDPHSEPLAGTEELSESEMQLLSALEAGEALDAIARKLGISTDSVRVLAVWLEREGRIVRRVQEASWKPALAAVPEPVDEPEVEPVPSSAPRVVPGAVGRPQARREIAGAASGMILYTGLACLALVGLVLGLWLEPMGGLMPLPWSKAPRLNWVEAQRVTASQAVKVAAVTYALLEGRWPEGAAPLVREGLARAQDVQHLEIGLDAANGESPKRSEASEGEDLGFRNLQFTPSDNFFLQQHATQPEARSSQPPLKLLD